jgi:hypothetical protein
MKTQHIIVPTSSEGEARELVQRWRQKHADLWSRLADGDVEVRQVLTDDGCKVQYVALLTAEDAATLQQRESDE